MYKQLWFSNTAEAGTGRRPGPATQVRNRLGQWGTVTQIRASVVQLKLQRENCNTVDILCKPVFFHSPGMRTRNTRLAWVIECSVLIHYAMCTNSYGFMTHSWGCTVRRPGPAPEQMIWQSNTKLGHRYSWSCSEKTYTSYYASQFSSILGTVHALCVWISHQVCKRAA